MALIAAHQEAMVVALDTAFISAEGRIDAAPGKLRDGAAAVDAVGRILEDITGGDLPGALKFAIAKATSSPPLYASVQEFSTMIAYFARPNREELLRGVYEQCKRVPPPPPPVSIQTGALIVRAEPAVRNVDRSPLRTRRNRRLAAAVVTLTLVGIGVWALGFRSSRDAARISGDTASAATTPGDSGPAPTGQDPTAPGTGQGRLIRLPEQAPGRRTASRSSETETAVSVPSAAGRVEFLAERAAPDAVAYSAADPSVMPPDAVTYRAADPRVMPPDAVTRRLSVIHTAPPIPASCRRLPCTRHFLCLHLRVTASPPSRLSSPNTALLNR